MKIKEIVIMGGSGFGPENEAYEDTLTLTESSLCYEYKPFLEENKSNHIYKKWSYKTTNSSFKKVFQDICDMTPKYLNNNDDLTNDEDGSPTSIIVKFDDKHREVGSYFCSRKYFDDYFKLFKDLVPATERIPAVLSTDE